MLCSPSTVWVIPSLTLCTASLMTRPFLTFIFYLKTTTATELQIRLMEYPQFSSFNKMEKLKAAWSQGVVLLKS